MRKIKDSGIEWIGEIPEDWNICKVKNIFTKKNEKAKIENPIVLSLARSGVKIRDISNNEGQLAESYYNYNLVAKGDLLLNPMDLYSGANCSISNVEGVISPAYINLGAKDNIVARYYDYYFKTQYWSMVLFAHGKGVSFDNRWTLNNETLMNYKLPLTSFEEQELIADYIDEKVQEIDNIILKTQKTIEEYKKYKQSVITEAVTKGLNPNVKMEDSGIEWIGKIPKHWSIKNLKMFTCKIGSGKTPLGGANIYTNEGVMFLRSQNIYNEGLYVDDVVYIPNDIDESMKSTRVYKNDVLINITGGSIGRCCVYNKSKHANVNQHVCIVRCNNSMIPKFMQYILISAIGINETFICQTGGNREGLTFEQISNFKITVVSKNEQKLIVDYLDKKCNEIDNLITKKQELINQLETYKKSLIYECVTGKKEVVPTYAY